MKILMLEDDPSICETLREYICDASQGRECDTAKTVAEAHRFLLNNRYDVILCDLLIEGVPCVEFLRSAKQIQPQSRMCVMSAWKGADKIAEENKINCFLSKPFDLDIIDELFFKES